MKRSIRNYVFAVHAFLLTRGSWGLLAFAGQQPPTAIFLDPPGGASVNGVYPARLEVTDEFGGTEVRLYYVADQESCSDTGAGCDEHATCLPNGFCRHDVLPHSGNPTFIVVHPKLVPGTAPLQLLWNLTGVPDGRYVLTAQLVPGAGVEGSEVAYSAPIAASGNIGNGQLLVEQVAIDTDDDDTDDRSRVETWTAVHTGSAEPSWRINGSLSQPVIDESDPDSDPWPRASTGQSYTSMGGEVTLTILPGPNAFAAGDSFSFTTTGFTAASEPVIVRGGRVSASPFAVISAAPTTGPAPLQVVFDGRDSIPQPGQALTYHWDFGDASPFSSEPVVGHIYTEPRTYTAVLRVIDLRSGLFGEAAVDITVSDGRSPGDVNGDACVDLLDYEQAFGCFTGPAVVGFPTICAPMDFTENGTIDLLDVAAFQRAFEG